MCTPPDEYSGPRPSAASSEAETPLVADDGAKLREFLASPSTGLADGALVVIHDIWGYTDFYKDLARRIAATGHAAAVPDFFGRQGDLPESMRAPERTGSKPEAMARAMERAQALSDERFLADLQREVDSLIERGAPRVAVWGFCLGGRLAYVAAARVRELSGVVAYYGFLSAQEGRLAPLALAPEISVPVLGVFGGADPGIPPDQIEQFDRALAGEHEIVSYPGAPHGFLRYGATQHKKAIDDALARTFQFLDRVLPKQVRAASS